jgi:hypothetical protein
LLELAGLDWYQVLAVRKYFTLVVVVAVQVDMQLVH